MPAHADGERGVVVGSRGAWILPIEARRSLNRLLVAKVVYGLALMAAAKFVPGRAAHHIDGRARLVAGAIGGRNVAEAAIIGRRPTTTATTTAAAIDTTHALSMLIVAINRPDRRRLTTVSAVTAGLFAVAGLRTTCRLWRSSTLLSRPETQARDLSLE